MPAESEAEFRLAAGDVVDGDVYGNGDALIGGAIRGRVTLGGKLHVLRGGSVDGRVSCRELVLFAGGEVRGLANVVGSAAGDGDPRELSPPTSSSVPAGFHVEGDVRCEDDLHISGCVDGDVRVHGCLRVGSTGRVEGSVRATHGVLDGEVLGAVHRTDAEPRSSAPNHKPAQIMEADVPRVGRVLARRRHPRPRIDIA